MQKFLPNSLRKNFSIKIFAKNNLCPNTQCGNQGEYKQSKFFHSYYNQFLMILAQNLVFDFCLRFLFQTNTLSAISLSW